MKRKTLLLILIGLFTNKLFATGVGIQIQAISPLSFYHFSLDKISNYSMDYEFLCLGTMKLERYNLIFGTGMNIGKEKDTIYFGNSGYLDYLFFDNQIKNNWNFNMGTGLNYSLMFAKEYGLKSSISGRLFLGMSWILFDGYIELYLQQNIGDRIYLNEPITNCLIFPTAIGIRWHY